MLGMFDRAVRPFRNPLNSQVVGGAGFTVGTESGNAITVAVQLRDAKSQDVRVRGSVSAFLSSDATGDTPLLDHDLPTSVAAGTDGSLLGTGYPRTGLLTTGTLAVHSTAEQFKTTATAYYRINGVQYSKAATTGMTFTAAHVVTASKFGVILVQVDAAGAVTTKVPSATQAYNTAALAAAALPAPDANKAVLGYIAVANNAGDWTANTDDLTAASDLTTATFVDGPVNGNTPTSFILTSEADGDVDVVVTDARVKTMYLCVRLPNGGLAVSGALAFA